MRDCAFCTSIEKIKKEHGEEVSERVVGLLIRAQQASNHHVSQMCQFFSDNNFKEAANRAALLVVIAMDLKYVLEHPETIGDNERHHQVFQECRDLFVSMEADTSIALAQRT